MEFVSSHPWEPRFCGTFSPLPIQSTGKWPMAGLALNSLTLTEMEHLIYETSHLLFLWAANVCPGSIFLASLPFALYHWHSVLLSQNSTGKIIYSEQKGVQPCFRGYWTQDTEVTSGEATTRDSHLPSTPGTTGIFTGWYPNLLSLILFNCFFAT